MLVWPPFIFKCCLSLIKHTFSHSIVFLVFLFLQKMAMFSYLFFFVHHYSCKYVSYSIDNGTSMAYYDFESPIYHADEDCDKDRELPEELAELLQQESKVIQPYQESLEIVNLGTEDNKKEIKIGVALDVDVKKVLNEVLHEYVDVFSWSYQDMPGLDTYIVVHKFPLKKECPLVKQKLRRT